MESGWFSRRICLLPYANWLSCLVMYVLPGRRVYAADDHIPNTPPRVIESKNSRIGDWRENLGCEGERSLVGSLLVYVDYRVDLRRLQPAT